MELNNSIYNLYHKLLVIKNKNNITNYPYNILNNNQVIFTKNQVELFYIDHFNICSSIDGGNSNNNNILTFYY